VDVSVSERNKRKGREVERKAFEGTVGTNTENAAL